MFRQFVTLSLFIAAVLSQNSSEPAIWHLAIFTAEYLEETNFCWPTQTIVEDPSTTDVTLGPFTSGGPALAMYEDTTALGCYNMATLQNENFTVLGTCDKLYDRNCGDGTFIWEDFTFDASTKYSVVGAIAPRDVNRRPTEEDRQKYPNRAGKLTLQTFADEDCSEDSDSNEWNCLTLLGSCSELSYNVRSFRVSRTEDPNTAQCLVAEEQRDSKAQGGATEDAQGGIAGRAKGFSAMVLGAAAFVAILVVW